MVYSLQKVFFCAVSRLVVRNPQEMTEADVRSLHIPSKTGVRPDSRVWDHYGPKKRAHTP
jgi:hypothetical protein